MVGTVTGPALSVTRLKASQDFGQFRPYSTELFLMGLGEPRQNLLAPAGHSDVDSPAIRCGGLSVQQFQLDQTIHQFHGAVMSELQALSQLPDRYHFPSRKPFDGQQSLMLLRGQAGMFGRGLAERKKPPEGVTKGRKVFVLSFR